MKKVFLTGASGLIGSYILKDLVRRDFNVKVLRRSKKGFSEFENNSQIEWVDGDLFDIPLLRDQLMDCEVVIHSAAIVSFNPKEKNKMFRTNIEGTRNLVDAALDAKVRRFVHVSSVAALGKTDDGKPISENTKWTSNDERANYDITKFNAELEVWRGAEEGLEVNVVNPSVVIGVSDWLKSSSRLFKFIYQNSKFYTDGIINYVDVRDVSKTVISLVTSSDFGKRMILCAGNIDFENFYSKVAHGFSKPTPKIKIPVWLLTVWQKIENVRASIFRVSPLITKETVRSLQRPSVYNNTESLKSGVDYTPLDESIKWITQSYVSKYDLK